MKRVALVLFAAMLVTACGSSGTSAPPGSPASAPASANPTGTASAAPTASTVVPKDARASAYLKGNTSPDLPAGKPGSVGVIAMGTVTESDPASTGAAVPIVVRNNTPQAVHEIAAAITARDTAGKVVASGSDQGFQPDLVQPGEIAIGFGYFEPGSNVSAKDTFDVQITSQPGAGNTAYGRADLAVTETNLSGGTIVGVLSNTSNAAISGPIQVNAICFTGNAPSFTVGTFANRDTVEPSGTASFQIDLYGQHCQTFLVGGSGYQQ